MERSHDQFPQILDKILQSYPMKIRSVEPHKLVYRVAGEKGYFALKEIKFPEEEFCYIYAAMEHLASHGFNRINKIVLTKEYYPFAEANGKRFFLSRWIDGREANYKEKKDLKKSAKTLAELHMSSRNFDPPPFQQRIKWGTWPDNFKQKKEQLITFKQQIQQKNYKTIFDQVFLMHVDYYVRECARALDILARGGYKKVNARDEKRKYFCHHDFAHHNIIIDKNGVGNVIDFDYCISDIRCHDLGSLVLRKLKKGEWDYKQALYIIKAYDKVLTVSSEETEVITALLRFPQDFWQVAFAYYVEKNQPEKRLEHKIKNWVLSKEMRAKSLQKLEKLM